MRVSELYELGVSQPSLEFLDVDINTDTKVFVDPHAFRYLDTDWALGCVALLQDFYNELLRAVQTENYLRGEYLLGQLNEPNEAHLGLSRREARGKGVGTTLAEEIFDALLSSEAVTSGIVEDIEETLLFVDGIGHDRVSDMTINIVRCPLIEFTQSMCDLYGIPTVPGLNSGPMWNRMTHSWEAVHVTMPMPSGKLLLVPKAVVRKTGTFDPGEYLTHFVLPYLQDRELANPHSALVRERRSKRLRGQRYVTKKSIRQRDGQRIKPWNTEVTHQNPEIMQRYRASRAARSEPPSHNEIANATGTPPPNWDELLNNVLSIASGRDDADNYHYAIQHLLTALFYPALDVPQREFKIHQGRKRIDIVYANVAATGFFHWVNKVANVPASSVVVECKNYTGALSNPEFDQLTGRFSPRRGRLGLLCYRGFGDNKTSVVRHCRDAALDDRGFVIPIDDQDLGVLVESRKNGEETIFEYLYSRYQELI
ncbi:hypothetical protein K3U93_18515 [Mycobacterium malmoense]|uniref:Restriction endonuclease type IV Mrr domain-containing protein n=1 Tax=Mycobacterium malmoense TaxID=1780 RepID=A0ABX3SR98_MYCMA|nr:hypothetical protein [Mycobacterium malmoense]ORA82085.1 hypothetical protein BST29_12905 [Mycobacterium malmoense]QZA16628.1 hypothetical protein K3U93_18515 [Mycobacterium malmoense]UNB93428.1 hypothetical protein H5T25_18500 [Mycobacterium malmoense]